MIHKPSIRAEIVTRRTYNRPIDELNEIYEDWEDTVDRVIDHQRWLWERALTHNVIPDMPLHDITEDMAEWVTLNDKQYRELGELRELILNRQVCPSGRTLWLGGTSISKRREASQFNCAHTNLETVYDIVDIFWLLLQGTGVGFTPIVGTLTGFKKKIPEIVVIESTRQDRGREENEEYFRDGIWYLSVGDCAEAWAKSIGKLLAGKYEAKKLILDFSQIRPAGRRLKGYGWISSGDNAIKIAYPAICEIMNRRAGSHLRKMDMLDIVNWLGTVLSSRRSAEIALVDYGSDEWEQFADAKKYCYDDEYKHRQQSNNSLVFYQKPTYVELLAVFERMISNGGSEPGFVNGAAAKKRAPWFKGFNPCAEILLGNKSFCNLVEVDLAKFKGDNLGLHDAITLVARANYRQTIVDFRDGILQEAWHLNNNFLRLCGVGVTGIAQCDEMTEYDWKNLRYSAVAGARSMATELNLESPKNVTTVKPSGTLSKIMDTTEGVHKPDGQYLFNWINFSNYDPIVEKLRSANYRWLINPSDPTGTIVCIPVKYSDTLNFTPTECSRKDGTVEIINLNKESAVVQLERYKKVQLYYCDQNVSNTVYYLPDERFDIVAWLIDNWDVYVGVSFLLKQDGSLSAKDLGYEYLPQEYVTEEKYNTYVNTLLDIDWDNTGSTEELGDEECPSGVCPVK